MSDSDDNPNIDAYIKSRRRRRIIGIVVVLLVAAAPVGMLFSGRAFEVSVVPVKAAASMSWKRTDGLLLMLGTQVLLFSGEGTIAIAATGFVSQEVGFSKTSAHQRVQIELKPLPGTAVIAVNSRTDFEVFVDQRSLGAASRIEVELERGVHSVSIGGAWIKPVNAEMHITGYGEIQHFQFETESSNSTFAVKTAPPEAEIFLDGTPVGQGTYEGMVELGDHDVVVELDGYHTQKRRFKAAADDHVDLGLIKLAPRTATLAIKSQPSGAAVLVNGEFAGSTPVRVSLAPLRTHRLTIRRTGRELIETRITPAPGEVIDRTFRLGGHTYQAEITADIRAKVTLNGTDHGTTPTRITVREGDRIGVSRNGYQPQTVIVAPVGGDQRSYAFTMMRPNEYAFYQAEKEIVVAQNMVLRKFPPVDIHLGSVDGERQGIEKRLTRPFYIGRREVAYEDYTAFQSRPIPRGLSPKHPVANLTWTEAAKFCNWLSGRNGLQPVYEFDAQGEVSRVVSSSLGYRLPTEAEWEAVAAHDFAKDQPVGPFPWGRKPTIPRAYGNFAGRETESLGRSFLRDHADNHRAAAPTGSYPANFNGLYDLAGNVAEWVTDYHAPVPAISKAPLVDPLGPATGIDHLVKGSSYRSDTLLKLASSHRAFEPTKSDSVGFRIAKWIY